MFCDVGGGLQMAEERAEATEMTEAMASQHAAAATRMQVRTPSANHPRTCGSVWMPSGGAKQHRDMV